MIASNSVLGLTEIRAVRATRDMIETGVINPNVRAEVAVNPDSELFPVTRSNGVLHALSVPQKWTDRWQIALMIWTAGRGKIWF